MDGNSTSATYHATTNTSAVNGSRSALPVMSYITCAIGVLGITGNAFVVIVITNATNMRRQLTNAYITNQSVIDALASLLLTLSVAFGDKGRRYGTMLDNLLCTLWFSRLPSWGLFLSSTYNLIMLTIERYLSIVHPVWHKTKFTRKKVMASIVFVWLFGPLYNAAFVTPTSGISATGHCRVMWFWPNDFWQHAVGVLTILIEYIAPLIIFLFSYTKMISKLRRRVGPVASTDPTRRGHSLNRAKKNILKTLLIVVFSFVFCWTWNQIYFLMFNVGGGNTDFGGNFYHFTMVMVFMNCCINPFIYAAKYEEFQNATKRLFRKHGTDLDSAQTENIHL